MWTFETYIGEDEVEVTIEITTYASVPGSFSFNAASDIDYYGYDELEWVVLDMDGKPASKELLAQMTESDERRIEDEAYDYMERWAEDEAALARYEASLDY